MRRRIDLMKELIDRYEQLEAVKTTPSARTVLKLYIRKLELKLMKELKDSEA